MDKIIISLENKKVVCHENEMLSDVILANNIALNMPCNAIGKCGKCKVEIKGERVEVSEMDKKLLTEEEIKNGVRLACCTKVFDKMEVVNISKEESKEFKIVHNESELAVINPVFEKYGICVDIGTTTIVLKLYDKNGILEITASKNPQRSMGADVIARIEKSLAGYSKELQQVIVKELNNMIKIVCDKVGIDNTEIDYGVFTGNTTMLYLLTCKNPVSLSKAPFESETLFDLEILGEDIGIEIANNGKIYLPKCMSAFVGADISTAILASGMIEDGKNNLLIDIGTNGEVALWKKDKLYTCSTAAGPTFEGAELSNGMSGMSGAIDKVFIQDDKVNISVIDDIQPKGICGSGVIDLLSTLVDIEAVDETGFLDEEILEEYGVLGENEDETSFMIKGINLTQKDVRKVQLAKGAICAGLLTVLKISDLSVDEVDNFYIAGGFGNFINLEKAVNIGLIPSGLLNKAKVIGNAALDGCSMMLCNKDEIEHINKIVIKSQNIELSSNKTFNEYYVESMMFDKM